MGAGLAEDAEGAEGAEGDGDGDGACARPTGMATLTSEAAANVAAKTRTPEPE